MGEIRPAIELVLRCPSSHRRGAYRRRRTCLGAGAVRRSACADRSRRLADGLADVCAEYRDSRGGMGRSDVRRPTGRHMAAIPLRRMEPTRFPIQCWRARSGMYRNRWTCTRCRSRRRQRWWGSMIFRRSAEVAHRRAATSEHDAGDVRDLMAATRRVALAPVLGSGQRLLPPAGALDGGHARRCRARVASAPLRSRRSSQPVIGPSPAKLPRRLVSRCGKSGTTASDGTPRNSAKTSELRQMRRCRACSGAHRITRFISRPVASGCAPTTVERIRDDEDVHTESLRDPA